MLDFLKLYFCFPSRNNVIKKKRRKRKNRLKIKISNYTQGVSFLNISPKLFMHA